MGYFGASIKLSVIFNAFSLLLVFNGVIYLIIVRLANKKEYDIGNYQPPVVITAVE